MNERTVPVSFTKKELYLLQATVKADHPENSRWKYPIAIKELNDKIAFAIGRWYANQKEEYLHLTERELICVDHRINAFEAGTTGESIVDKICKGRWELYCFNEGFNLADLKKRHEEEVAEYASGSANEDNKPDNNPDNNSNDLY